MRVFLPLNIFAIEIYNGKGSLGAVKPALYRTTQTEVHFGFATPVLSVTFLYSHLFFQLFQ